MDAGHDLLLAVDAEVSDEVRELAADLGVDFDAKGMAVVDHFGTDVDHGTVATRSWVASPAIFGTQRAGGAVPLFR